MAMMKRAKILYLFMGVWMLLATSASAAFAVCQAPCCMPGGSEKPQEMNASGGCCDHSASTEADAAAFFADSYTPPAQNIASDDGEGCHVKASEKCVAQLHKGGEYVTHTLTVQLDAPEEAFAPTCAALLDHPGFGQATRPVAASPPCSASSPIFLKVSSLLC